MCFNARFKSQFFEKPFTIPILVIIAILVIFPLSSICRPVHADLKTFWANFLRWLIKTIRFSYAWQHIILPYFNYFWHLGLQRSKSEYNFGKNSFTSGCCLRVCVVSFQRLHGTVLTFQILSSCQLHKKVGPEFITDFLVSFSICLIIHFMLLTVLCRSLKMFLARSWCLAVLLMILSMWFTMMLRMMTSEV